MGWESEMYMQAGASPQPLISWQPPLMYNLTAPPVVHGSGSDVLDRFDAMVTDNSIRSASRQLFVQGHYATAVEKAFVCLDNAVSTLSGAIDKFGAELMFMAFDPKSPLLALNSLCSTSDKSEQKGYGHIFAGVMTGIRNRRAHESDFEDSPEEALELLVLANHLMRKLAGARRCPSNLN